MHKILIMDQEQQLPKRGFKLYRKRNKTIKINDSLFEIGLRKGLIEKNEDGYYFVGDYNELLAFKYKKLVDSFEWLE